LFDKIDEGRLSPTGMIDLFRGAAIIDSGGITALSTSDFEISFYTVCELLVRSRGWGPYN
jgi:hypothetical protein